MSSGFVSSGNNDWVRAQAEIEERTRAKLAEGKQDGGKTLYEVLQQNKAAKQEAFEESAKLKNQFRALDEDEVDFLKSINESERTKEDAIKQETAEQLEVFRKQREAADAARLESEKQAAPIHNAAQDESIWATKPKKRRREKDSAQAHQQKLVKTSPAAVDLSTKVEEADAEDTRQPRGDIVTKDQHKESNTVTLVKTTSSSPKKTAALGLDYSSDGEQG